MTTEIIHHVPDPEQAVQWLTPLLPSPLATKAERDKTAKAIELLSQPADNRWILARVAALLLPYYNADTAQAVRELEAEDWRDALSPYPKWAIERAVRWWKSAENKKRHKRPVEGDIVERAKMEMGLVKYAQFRVREFDGKAEDHAKRLQRPTEPERVTAEAASSIMADAGFAPKKMPG